MKLPLLVLLGALCACAHDMHLFSRRCDRGYGNRLGGAPLCGEAVWRRRGCRKAYAKAANQYASSSLPGQLRPNLIVMAECDEDIKAALRYASECNATVSIRSGGHQYMGLSSCNAASGTQRCVQIDLSRYETLALTASGTFRAGAGVDLGTVYNFLSERGLFIPGGQCSTVNIGGHVQTGGFGILSTGFGALAQSVRSFDIITADMETRSVVHPAQAAALPNATLNNELWYAVLGGGAGSWGVVTHYEVAPIPDAAFSHAVYYVCSWEYDADVHRAMLNAYVEIYGDIENDRNVALWIQAYEFEPVTKNVLKFEGMYLGVVPGSKDYDALLTRFINLGAGLSKLPGHPCTIDREQPVSKMILDYFVVQRPREIELPYIKMMQYASKPPTPEFVGALMGQVEEIMGNSRGLGYIGQVTHLGSGFDPSIALSDGNGTASFSLISDVFYNVTANPNSLTEGREFNKDMDRIIGESGLFAEQRRSTWATYGNVNIEEVWPLYYYEASYLKLRQIKSNVDPDNVFRTAFTIPPL